MHNANLKEYQKTELNLELEKLINKSKESVKDLKKVALAEAWGLLQIAIASIVRIVETKLEKLNGIDKKAIALESINRFYDGVFVVIDVPFVPTALEPMIHKYTKAMLMIMAGSAIDAMVTVFREVGVFITNKKGTNT